MTPAARGTLIALSSAAAFGVATPLVQQFGRAAGPFTVAALLYGGAALVGAVGGNAGEAKVTRAHLPRLVAIAIVGAGIAPAALAWGLSRTSGVAASLMLNLEAVFTLVLAWLLYSEHLGRRVIGAAAVMVIGGGLLVLDRGGHGRVSVIGLAAIAVAALAWAADNTIAKPLSALDPARVVAIKGGIGAAISLGASFALSEAWPDLRSALVLAAVGATGYGLSLRLYLRAQRTLGAARTASVFASAPFWGAALALGMGEHATLLAALGAVAMIVGVVLHVTEHHEHRHIHDPITHEHAHRHDDGHHSHVHETMPVGEHSHAHSHEGVTHSHAHLPDIHHEHRH